MNLILFTSKYPYGHGESFIETEIQVISKKFNKIYILPLANDGKSRNVPKNCQVIDLGFKYKRIEVLKNDFLFFLKILFVEIIVNGLSNLSYKSSFLLRCISKSYRLSFWLKKNNIKNPVFYSYWFDNWATILSILKIKNEIKKFYSRAHGFDLYDYRSESKSIPFRQLQLKNVGKVFCVSKDGFKYLSKKYPNFKSKFAVSYLGSIDYGLSSFVRCKETSILTISRIDQNKNLEKIISVFSKINKPIVWTHYGDGPMMNRIEELSKRLPSNVKIIFKGYIDHEKMLGEIKDSFFDVFLNVSNSEGLPVSIMESISFGIPVIATDVGGVSEIVCSQTGKLISKDFDVYLLLSIISNFKESKMASDFFRNSVRLYWEKHFNAISNYNTFVDEIINRDQDHEK